MDTYVICETGCVRKKNEDAFLSLPALGLWAVADGMGGHRAGEVASALATVTLKNMSEQLVSLDQYQVLTWMEEAFIRANAAILAAASEGERWGMGTTLTAFALTGNKAVIGHIGDSRVYLWRRAQLQQLTHDHSWVQSLVDEGTLTPEEARNHPRKNELTRALGADDAVPDGISLEICPGDVFLLCTDGFSNVYSEDDLTASLRERVPCQDTLRHWRDIVLERGAPDNFTLVTVVFP
jgi:protein phosphatase